MSEETNALAEAFGGGDNLPTAFSPNALMQSTAAIPRTTDKPYLTFRDGEWTFGQDAAECDPNALWAVNPNSFYFGLIEWLDSVAGGEVLVPAGTPYNANDLVLKFDPENPEHRIAPQIACDLYCINGDDEGLQVCYKTSTRGGVDALNGLAQKIAKQGAADTDEIVAIVTLDGSHYMHKKHKRKTYVPILNLEGFDNFDLTNTHAMLAEEEGEPEPETKPPARGRGRTSKAAAKDDKKSDAPPPSRRRRAK